MLGEDLAPSLPLIWRMLCSWWGGLDEDDDDDDDDDDDEMMMVMIKMDYYHYYFSMKEEAAMNGFTLAGRSTNHFLGTKCSCI